MLQYNRIQNTAKYSSGSGLCVKDGVLKHVMRSLFGELMLAVLLAACIIIKPLHVRVLHTVVLLLPVLERWGPTE